ncbi:hypothetical protein D3C78_1369600 [compost metagenome]
MALPVWALFMKRVYADPTLKISKGNFEKPADLTIELDCSVYVGDSTDVDHDEHEPPPSDSKDKDRLGF